MAFPYLPKGKRMPFMDIGWMAPAGQMYSTIDDLAKLGMMFAQPEKQKLFKTATLREMMTPKNIAPDGVTVWGSPFEMVFKKNVLIRTKGGNIDTYDALITFIPELALGANLLISTKYYVGQAGLPKGSTLLYNLLVPILNETLFDLQNDSHFPIDPIPFLGKFQVTQTIAVFGKTNIFNVTQEYSRNLNQATAQAGHISPSTSFQTAAQVGQPSPSTSFKALQRKEECSSSNKTPDNTDSSSSSSDSESEHEEKESTPLILSASSRNKVRIQEVIEKEKERSHQPEFSSRSSSEEDLTACSMDHHFLSSLQENITELQRQRRRLRPTSDAALAELALHLAGPAESFFRSLSSSDKGDFDALSAALRERFSSKDRVWRMRQVLSARKQGSSEPLDKYIEDLQNKFDCLELTEEEKVWFFTQGLRPDTQREVLMRQPRTFREAENAARLTQTVQQSLQDAKGNDALTRMQQQLDVLTSSLAVKDKPKEATVSAYRYSPQTSVDDKLIRLERDVKQIMTVVNQFNPESVLAAYRTNAPRENNYNRDIKDHENTRLKEEIRQLKATLHESQPQRGRQTDSYARNNPPQEVNSDLSSVLEEIRRMQSRMDGFMRTYASRNSRQDQRVQTRDYRPICDICGKTGHVRQHCFHRFQQSPNYWPSQTVQHNREIVESQPQVAAYEHVQEAPSRNQPSYDYTNLARRSQPLPSSSTSASTEVPTINTIDAVTIYRPTKRKDIEEMDPDAISKRHTRDAPIRAHSANDKQEIVVRIEICTDNKTSNSKNVTLMPNPEENIGKEKSKLPVSATVKMEKILPAKVKQREDNTRITCSLQPAETVVPLQKQPSTKTPTSPITPLNEEPARTAFVAAKILGYPVDLLVDSGACISVIDAEFVNEVFSNDTAAIDPSIYSRVDTVSGEKLPTIGKIEVNLSFNGRKFPYGTLKLDNIHPIDLSMKATQAQPLATLTVQDNKQAEQHKDKEPVSIYPNFDRFIQQCKKTTIFFLKFLIILLLMSPHGHAAAASDHELQLSKEISPTTKVHSSTNCLCPSLNVQARPAFSAKLLFLLTPVRLKDHISSTRVVERKEIQPIDASLRSRLQYS
ncbi:Putative beta-lactamase-like 1 [Desmophyllum pertusum]|uniref:Beta-lactamase-like 1 n=1 Tax=Desmophyllum pertusum TaxID=174260 RepID=A0A9X0CQT2_9CNID|nr:Putative beta-lactamase-like 1 [Desmophyllum pertusum]